MRHLRFLISSCFILIFTFSAWANTRPSLTDQANIIYKKHHQAVFQIRVVNRVTGEKSALGSGFQFTRDGYMATNYHVVSDAVLYPNIDRVECVRYNGDVFSATILNVDPIHDLAILKIETPQADILELGESTFDKGTKIFSLGNPYDLGMTIVEGLYNGIMERSMYRKILFSGSLNPGMSGGPALGQDGKVLGINVSTAGNQISFFVPVDYLRDLVEEVRRADSIPSGFRDTIRKRLAEHQAWFVNRLIDQDKWKTRTLGPFHVPGEISDEFKCWARSGDNKQYWLNRTRLACFTEDSIFLSSTMRTGRLAIDYAWFEARSFDPFRFYNLYQDEVQGRVYPFDNVAERDAKNFQCGNSFYQIDGQLFYVSMCARPYKDFNGLFDLSVKFSSVGIMAGGLAIDVVLLGVTEMHGKDFIRRFMREVKWQR